MLSAGRYRAEKKMVPVETPVRREEMWIQQNEVRAILERWTTVGEAGGRSDSGELEKAWCYFP